MVNGQTQTTTTRREDGLIVTTTEVSALLGFGEQPSTILRRRLFGGGRGRRRIAIKSAEQIRQEQLAEARRAFLKIPTPTPASFQPLGFAKSVFDVPASFEPTLSPQLRALRLIEQQAATVGIGGVQAQVFAAQKAKFNEQARQALAIQQKANQEIERLNEKAETLTAEQERLQRVINAGVAPVSAINNQIKAFNKKISDFEKSQQKAIEQGDRSQAIVSELQLREKAINRIEDRLGERRTEIIEPKDFPPVQFRRPLTKEEVIERREDVDLPTGEQIVAGVLKFPERTLITSPMESAREFKQAGRIGFESFFGERVQEVFGKRAKEIQKDVFGDIAGITGGVLGVFDPFFTAAERGAGKLAKAGTQEIITGFEKTTGEPFQFETPKVFLPQTFAFEVAKGVGGVVTPKEGERVGFQFGKLEVARLAVPLAQTAITAELLLGFPVGKRVAKPIIQKVGRATTVITPKAGRVFVEAGKIGKVKVQEVFGVQEFETRAFFGLGKPQRFEQLTQIIAVSQKRPPAVVAKKPAAPSPSPRKKLPVGAELPAPVVAERAVTVPKFDLARVAKKAPRLERRNFFEVVTDLSKKGGVPSTKLIQEQFGLTFVGRRVIIPLEFGKKAELIVSPKTPIQTFKRSFLEQLSKGKPEEFRGFTVGETIEKEIFGISKKAERVVTKPEKIVSGKPLTFKLVEPEKILKVKQAKKFRIKEGLFTQNFFAAEDLKPVVAVFPIEKGKPIFREMPFKGLRGKGIKVKEKLEPLQVGEQRQTALTLIQSQVDKKGLSGVLTTDTKQLFAFFPAREIGLVKFSSEFQKVKTGFDKFVSNILKRPPTKTEGVAVIVPRGKTEIAGIDIQKPPRKGGALPLELGFEGEKPILGFTPQITTKAKPVKPKKPKSAFEEFQDVIKEAEKAERERELKAPEKKIFRRITIAEALGEGKTSAIAKALGIGKPSKIAKALGAGKPSAIAKALGEGKTSTIAKAIQKERDAFRKLLFKKPISQDGFVTFIKPKGKAKPMKPFAGLIQIAQKPQKPTIKFKPAKAEPITAKGKGGTVQILRPREEFKTEQEFLRLRAKRKKPFEMLEEQLEFAAIQPAQEFAFFSEILKPKQKKVLIPRSFEKLEQKFLGDVSKPVEALSFKDRFGERFGEKSADAFKDLQKVVSRERTARRTREAERLRELTRTRTVTKPFDFGFDFPPIKPPPPPPKIKVPPLPPLDFGLEDFELFAGSGKKKGFNTLVRKKGKFVKENIKALPRNKALNLGGRVVDNEPAAAFKLEDAKKTTKEIDDLFFSLGFKFRPSKRAKDVFIEKEFYRIDSAGEVRGIPKKAAELRRQRSFLSSLFGGGF